MWVHNSLNILKCCRTSHKEPEVPDEAEEGVTVEDLLA